MAKKQNNKSINDNIPIYNNEETKTKKISKINWKYLNKDIVCQDLDTKICRNELYIRWGILISGLIIVLSIIVWSSIFLSGGFEYNDQALVIAGFSILVGLVAIVSLICFTILLLAKKNSIASIIIVTVIIVIFTISILLIQTGWFM